MAHKKGAGSSRNGRDSESRQHYSSPERNQA
jgi:ribosomal protein L27